jgi:hypothetical protein
MLLCVNTPDLPRALWEELLDALDAVSPLVDDVCPGLAFLDMRGIEGTPPEWMARTRALLAPLHVALRLGAGCNKIVARAAAHVTDGSVCAEGRERALLAPLPLALLDVDRDTTERLRLLGIDRLGDLARLPHGPFVRRFGSQAARWHALANGIDRTPFVPRGHAAAIEASIFGEGRADDEAQVIFALRMLLARIAADLECCGKRAGALALDIELEDAHTHRFEIPLAAPTAQERAMLDVVRAKLEGTTFPSAIVGLRVRAGELEEGGEALPLITGDDFDPQTVAVTIARLEAALGATVQRAHTHPAHVLEERYTYDRFTPPKRTPNSESSYHAERNSRTASVVEAAVEAPPDEILVPQLRLLAVAEISVQVRHGEPAFIGDPPQAVLECAGPWRIDLDGFPGEPLARDEYDVVLEDGRRCRIYHQGPHWYLRGLYD